MYWNYSKYNDLTRTLNVNKVLTKEHQVVHGWPADEVSILKCLVLQTLRIYSHNITLLLKTKRQKKLHGFF